jgi:hypothetical protein
MKIDEIVKEAAWKAVRPICFVNKRQLVKNKVCSKYWPMQ